MQHNADTGPADESRSSLLRGQTTESTPHRIAASAVELILEKGYRGTSVDDIVAHAGLTKPTFYYHFDSKLELLTAVLHNSLARIEDALASAENLDIPPRKRLSELVKAYVLEVCDRPGLWTIYFSERKEIPSETLLHWKKRERTMVAVIERTIEAGIAEGEFRQADALIAAMSVMGMAGWLHHWFRPSGALTAGAIATAMASLACDGLRLPSTETSRLSSERVSG